MIIVNERELDVKNIFEVVWYIIDMQAKLRFNLSYDTWETIRLIEETFKDDDLSERILKDINIKLSAQGISEKDKIYEYYLDKRMKITNQDDHEFLTFILNHPVDKVLKFKKVKVTYSYNYARPNGTSTKSISGRGSTYLWIPEGEDQNAFLANWVVKEKHKININVSNIIPYSRITRYVFQDNGILNLKISKDIEDLIEKKENKN